MLGKAAHNRPLRRIDTHQTDGFGDGHVTVRELQHGKDFKGGCHGLHLFRQVGILADRGHFALRVGKAVVVIGFDHHI